MTFNGIRKSFSPLHSPLLGVTAIIRVSGQTLVKKSVPVTFLAAVRLAAKMCSFDFERTLKVNVGANVRLNFWNCSDKMNISHAAYHSIGLKIYKRFVRRSTKHFHN